MINRNVRALVDSLACLDMEEQMERLLNTLEEKETNVFLFDTDKLTDDSTGLPLVKAIARQKVKREVVERKDNQKKVQSETELKEETTDNCVEKITAATEVEQKGSWWDIFKRRLMYILLIPVLVIALWATYKLIKILK